MICRATKFYNMRNVSIYCMFANKQIQVFLIWWFGVSYSVMFRDYSWLYTQRSLSKDWRTIFVAGPSYFLIWNYRRRPHLSEQHDTEMRTTLWQMYQNRISEEKQMIFFTKNLRARYIIKTACSKMVHQE